MKIFKFEHGEGAEIIASGNAKEAIIEFFGTIFVCLCALGFIISYLAIMIPVTIVSRIVGFCRKEITLFTGKKVG